MIRNLAIKGGGARGEAYLGALPELQKAGILQNIIRIAGVSAGGITAALLALRYTPDEIIAIMAKTPLSMFEDQWNPLRLISSYGLYSGDAFQKWIGEQINGSRLYPHLTQTSTFKDLQDSEGLDLHVFATNICTHKLQRFSAITTPNSRIDEAVRATMSIPGLFKPMKFSNGAMQGHSFGDAGLVYNNPIDAFDASGPNPETLGLFLYDINQKKDIGILPNYRPRLWIENTLESLLEAQDIDFFQCEANVNRSIIIDTGGVSSFNFGISPAQIEMLTRNGSAATVEYIAKNQGRFN